MKKDEELILNQKYTLGKRVYWFLFLSKHKKMLIMSLLLLALIFYINTISFQDRWVLINQSITISMLNLWFISAFLGSIIILLVVTFEKYHQYKFVLSEHSFNIRKGLFMVKEKIIPYRHIQNVDLYQPYHYRLFGIAKLDIITAGQDNGQNDIKNLIPLIDKRLARKLLNFLIQQGVKSHNNTLIQE